MQNRLLAVLLTILVVVLCGLPGIGGALVGLLAIMGSFLTPTAPTATASSGDDMLFALLGGGFILCASIFVLIFAAVAVFFLLRKPKYTLPDSEFDENEPLPPAI
jgi:hypothetical protein